VIIDNIINTELQEQIKTTITAETFPWFWCDGLIKFDVAKNNEIASIYPYPENPMFMYQISKYKEMFNQDLYNTIVVPILTAFQNKTGHKVKYVNRSQLNLVPRQIITEAEYAGALHRDRQLSEPIQHEKFITLLYYPVDCDGPTITYAEDMSILESCDPVQGRLFYYLSKTLHRLEVPQQSKRRLSININIEIH
jgi:hypothetical protein